MSDYNIYGFAVVGPDGRRIDPTELYVPCPRCGYHAMAWIQSSYQCPKCRFKEGCCNGYPAGMTAFQIPAQQQPA